MDFSNEQRSLLSLLARGGRPRRIAGGWQADDSICGHAEVAALEAARLISARVGGLHLTAAGEARFSRRDSKACGGQILVDRIQPGDAPVETEGAECAPPRSYRSVRVNLCESPLGWLLARRLISERQHAAGDRLRADWTRAQLAPRVTMRWDRSPGGGGDAASDEPTLARIAAGKRFDQAVRHVGSGLGDILWRVVCAGEGLTEAETALGWPRRAGKLVLGLALDRLAEFYHVD